MVAHSPFLCYNGSAENRPPVLAAAERIGNGSDIPENGRNFKGGLFMKRIILVLLALLLALSPCALCEEDDGGEGAINLIEEQDSFANAGSLSLSEPFTPDGLEKTILIGDDRVTVKKTKQYPYSAIANITGKFSCGCPTQSTGFMVTRNTLLTAAHCLVCQKHNKWAKKLTFYFGYKSNKNYLYRYKSHWEAYVGTLFPNGYTSENDWAYVVFDKDVGDKTGWFGLKNLSDSELESGTFTVAGYRDKKLKYDVGGLRVMDSDRMWVDMDVLPGNSGSPIYDSDNYAVGIWTTYYDNANSGFRINSKVLDKLRAEGLL